MKFVTRFAPSPTGPLHLGHAYSALLAHDMARQARGRFLLRMEDTDRARSKPHWERQILDDLAWLGITWDGPVLRQSDHLGRYDRFITDLAARGLLYPCSCSRADIRAAATAPQEGHRPEIYPGTCRHRSMSSRRPGDALRLDMEAALDRLGPRQRAFTETGPARAGTHGISRARALNTIGDVVISRRGDAMVAYFLASAIDDAHQHIAHVVRGEDLFDFTPVQVILLTLLDLPVPHYHHHRLIRDEQGKRLAKRDDARAIARYRAEGASPGDVRAMVGLAASSF